METIHAIYEFFCSWFSLLGIGCTFIAGLCTGLMYTRHLFRKYQGKSLWFVSEDDAYQSWNKMQDFIMDRVHMVHDGAIDQCQEWGIDHLPLDKIPPENISWWLSQSNVGSFIWLCNVLGISIHLRTKKPKEEMTKEEYDAICGTWETYHGKLGDKVFSLISLLLSGGALLSIIAFFILRVQDN